MIQSSKCSNLVLKIIYTTLDIKYAGDKMMGKKLLAGILVLVLMVAALGMIWAVREEYLKFEEEKEIAVETGTVTIKVTDKPTDNFTAVYVTFSEVKVHKEGAGESAWTTITVNTTTVNLLALRDTGLTETLGVSEIGTGNYTKLWIVVDSVTGVLNGSGKTVNITVPSGDLKIQRPFVVGTGSTGITVDFDLDLCIIATGGGPTDYGVKKYIFRPVIGAVEVDHDGVPDDISPTDFEDVSPHVVEAHAPVASAEASDRTVEPGQNIQFDASGSYDINGDALTYSWDFDDGNTSTDICPVHSYAVAGDYTVTLTISDGELTATVTISITVTGGTVTMKVTDKPTDNFTHVNVTFSEVKIHREAGNDSGWFNITFETKTVDLLALRDTGSTETLGMADVGIGNYTMIWIVVDSVTGVLNGSGKTVNITVPSGDLKIQRPFVVGVGGTNITVDFDLDLCIIAAGGSGHGGADVQRYIFRPVICAVMVEYDGVPDDVNATEFEAPIAVIDVPTDNVGVGENVSFDATASYGFDVGNATYGWDFGDGNNITTDMPTVTYNYSAAGEYTVTLTVSDGELSVTVTIEIVVTEA